MICTDEPSTETDSRDDPQPFTSTGFPHHRQAELLKSATAAVVSITGEYDEDLIQLVCMKAIKSWPTYKPSFALSTWVSTITRTVRLDEIKSTAAREKRVINVDDEVLNRVLNHAQESRRPNGRPGLTDAQKFGLLRMHVDRDLTIRGVWRFLRLSKDARKAMGFKGCPSRVTILRAIQWAREQ